MINKMIPTLLPRLGASMVTLRSVASSWGIRKGHRRLCRSYRMDVATSKCVFSPKLLDYERGMSRGIILVEDPAVCAEIVPAAGTGHQHRSIQSLASQQAHIYDE
ncbi:hypothetical protein Trydic_g21212 [Trypoxylus dichotomus]